MTTQNVERRAMLKVWRRIVPPMVAVLFVSFLNKVGIGFAALQMNQELGFSTTVFGAGAGCFAIGYALFGIPSTLLLHRFGARRWIGVTLVAWTLCSVATAFITRPGEFLAVRLLLGIAEAGFAPGVILYLSYWFPNEYRGRVLSTLWFINPLGFVIGGPVSSALLSWNSVPGVSGWQWLFIVESFPALLLAITVFWLLTDRPADARWLAATEKDWLGERLSLDRQAMAGSQGGLSIWRTLANRRILLLAATYLVIGTSGVGTIFFLPLMIRSMGFSIWNTGLVTVVPAVAAAVSLPLWGIWADRTHSREGVVAAACFASGVGLLGAAVLLPSAWAIVPICVAMMGLNGCLVAFWTLPSAILSGASAAAGIAFINIVGNLGTFSGPWLLGWTSDLTQSYTVGLTCLAAIITTTAVVMTLQSIQNRELPDRSLTPQPVTE